MEWFHSLSPALTDSDIHHFCTLQNLPQLCSDVYEVTVSSDNPRLAEISCIWGVFQTEAYPVKNGVRYALTSCPNAFQWTVTTRYGKTTVHGSINQETADPEFVETLRDFMLHFHEGLTACRTWPETSAMPG